MRSIKEGFKHIYSLNIEKVSIYLISFLLPFQTIITVWIVILLCLYEIYLIFCRKAYISEFKFTLSGILMLLYFLYIIGLLYTDDITEGMIQLRIKLPLLVFPLIFLMPGTRFLRYTDILQVFISGCIITFLICLYMAFGNSFSIVDGKLVFNAIIYASGDHIFLDSIRRSSNYFFGSYLSFFMHPTYYSMYITIGIIGLLELRQYHKHVLIVRTRLLFWSILSLMFIAIFMLTSKASILILFMVSVAWILFRGRFILRLLGKILSLVLLSLIFIMVIRVNPRFKTSIAILKEYNNGKSLEEYIESKESAAVRLLIWREAIDVAKDNPMIGVGSGDVKNALLKSYQMSNLSGALEEQYNAHNQYLETFIAVGLIGLCVLILVLILPPLLVKSEKKYILTFFLLLVGSDFLFESMLNRQAGVMFFAFFYSFFLSNPSIVSGRKDSSVAKLLFDKIVSFLGLIVILPLGIIIAILIRLSSKGPVFFKQSRIGLNGKKFRMIKFRTMHPKKGSTVSVSTDPRITDFGKYLRKWKLDELPELWNILKGDMSFVGPRPDVPGFADKLEGEERKILLLRPGMTGPASIKYADEEYLLSKVENPEEYNMNVIWPDKVKINLEYYYLNNIWIDIKYIIQTISPKKKKN